MEMQEKWTNCLNLANEHVCGTAFQAFCVAVGIPSDSSHEEKLDMFIDELIDKYEKDHDRAQVRATLYLTTEAGGDDDIFSDGDVDLPLDKDGETIKFTPKKTMSKHIREIRTLFSQIINSNISEDTPKWHLLVYPKTRGGKYGERVPWTYNLQLVIERTKN